MPTYKPRKIIRDLENKGCKQIKNNGGSHQKIRSPDGKKTSLVITNRELADHEVKTIYTQLGLKWEK